MAHILIIGAGVVGLQTAVTLLEAGYRVTVVAEHFPGDESIEYTSPWAGAIWRTHASREQVEQCQWDLQSYREWMEVLEDPARAEKMGIQGGPMYLYSAVPGIDADSPSLWFSAHVRNFRLLSPSDLPPGAHSGASHDSVVVNPPKYLAYLLSTAKELGARVLKAHLPSDKGLGAAIQAAAELVPNPLSPSEDRSFAAAINCSGLGASSLCKDAGMYPIRGQTVLVRTTPIPPVSALRVVLHEDPAISPASTYAFPRPGTDLFLLGGTKKADDWTPTPDPDITAGIIERCRTSYPELRDVDLEIVSEQVGLRPARRGGARVEMERIDVGGLKPMDVIHQYGHAGAGYQNSIGSARKVLGLVREVLGERES